MQIKKLFKPILLALTLTTATSAHAVLDLTGVTMQGELFINDTVPPQTNFFDPVVGKVPAGFGNSPFPGGSGEAEALVSDSIVEFGYAGSVDANIQVNFSNNGFVQVSASNNPFSSVSMNFVSPAFTPQVTLTTITGSSNITPVYANNTATFTFTGMSPFSFTGTYLLNIAGTPPPQIPEPASLTLLALGLAGIIARCRKRA